MILVASAAVHNQGSRQADAGLILIKMLRQRDLGSQDAASLGEHALLTGGQPMLVDITLGEISHDFGDFVHIAGGDLLDVQLVPAGPVHFLFDDRSTQNLEDLRDLLAPTMSRTPTFLAFSTEH